MREVISKILEKHSKQYECVVVEECLLYFIEELDRSLKENTSNYCFIEYYDSEEIVVACGLNTIYVELDYEIREIVKVKAKINN
jgi:hypothetical protein